MADNAENGFYSDDDLDALPADALSALEHKAVQSTQQKNPSMTHAQHQQRQQNKHIPTKPSVQTLPAQPRYDGRKAQQYAQSVDYPQQPSSDYGNFDDEDLEADLLDAGDFANLADEGQNTLVERIVGENIQREEWRQDRYSAATGYQQPAQYYQPVRRPVVADLSVQREGDASEDHEDDDEEMLDQPAVRIEHQRGNAVVGQQDNAVDALQAQLLRERDTLQQAVHTANSTALSKAGEIAIVRANQAKTATEYERRLNTAQKLHADEAARQRAEIESARAEKEKIATENMFLKRDLTEEGEQTRILRRNLKNVGGGDKVVLAKTKANASPVTTPKKHKSLPFRDGFDDDEIMVTSPSKVAQKTKRGTPKVGDKRKRKVIDDSPGQPLQLSQSKGETITEDEPQPDVPLEDTTLQKLGKEDDRFPVRPVLTTKMAETNLGYKFVQSVFNHRLHRGQDRTIEAFTKLAFPSAPGRLFSSILLEGLSLLSVKKDMEQFPAKFAEIILSIWSQCVEEKYYSPLEILLDLITFILVQDTLGTAPHLIDNLIPLAQITADINAIPRFQRFKRETSTELKPGVDVEDCLNIIYLVACGCMHRDADIKRFWRVMRWDFVLIMLKASQPVEEIQVMLDILSTSILKETFGPIIVGDQDQKTNEKHIIERLTALLIEEPIISEGEEPYDEAEIAELRIDVLGVLDALCETKHGGEALAKHEMAIGRIVRVMNDQLNHLYDFHFEHAMR
ncbi:MAG: hypothetical protein M1830_004670, partial [Pleopsidium flavum]